MKNLIVLVLLASLSAMFLTSCQILTKPDVPENFVFVQGGTIHPTDGIYTDGLTVSSFYIDKYEITNTEWEAVMGIDKGYPHRYVNWLSTIEYCNRRSIQEGLTPCYSYHTYGTEPADWPDSFDTIASNQDKVSCDFNANGYRLPTEKEWEYAARGGKKGNGHIYAGSDKIEEVAWYAGNSDEALHPVGMKKPNELGIYDMSGNLWEWCWDWHSGSDRVLRGGYFNGSANYCTVSYRSNSYAASSYHYIGFRICRVSP